MEIREDGTNLLLETSGIAQEPSTQPFFFITVCSAPRPSRPGVRRLSPSRGSEGENEVEPRYPHQPPQAEVHEEQETAKSSESELFPGNGGEGKRSFESEFQVGSSETQWLNLSVSASASCYGSTSLANSEQAPPEIATLQQQMNNILETRNTQKIQRGRYARKVGWEELHHYRSKF